MRNSLIYLSIISICAILFSCTKEFLDKKPDKKLAIPATLREFQAMLDENRMFERNPFWGEWGTDNYYIDYATWQSMSPNYKNGYVWEKDILEGRDEFDWRYPYEQVYIANLALDGIKEIDINASNGADYNLVKGMALYFRAVAFYNLTQVFAKQYNAGTASSELGIVLRLNSNLNETSKRSTLQETYDRIIADLTESVKLLPQPVDFIFRNRPSRPCAYAMLARTYLTMTNYEMAGKYADSSLQLYNVLLDYNTPSLLNSTAIRPFPRINVEVMADCFVRSGLSFSNQNYLIDSSLYNSYDSNDLRKKLFFRNNSQGKPFFRGQYTGLTTLVGAVCTDEMYLIRAECNARASNISAAMADLNTLLEKRWLAGTFVELTATDATDALNKVLIERRKELIGRGLRLTDLKRLNTEQQSAVTLIRELNGQVYTLPPNDSRYVYQIPDNEILNSGIQQNIRQ